MNTAHRYFLTTVLTLVVALPLSPAALGRAKDLEGYQASLFMLEPEYGRTLLQLDGVNLQTMGGTPFGDLSTQQAIPPQLAFSPDGTKVAYQVNHCAGCAGFASRYVTIRVFSIYGTLLVRFHPKVALFPASVSNDGRFVSGISSTGWVTLETVKGRPVGSVSEQGCCNPNLYDASADRVYVPTTQAHDLHIAAYAARTGAVLGQLTLPGLGSVNQEMAAGPNEMPILHLHAAAEALSPDGRRLAVVDGERQKLTLIDAPNLRVMGTQQITHPQSLAQRVLELSGLFPEVAYAKGRPQGFSLQVAFSGDGTALYLMGTRFDINASGQSVATALGIQRIDAATGQIQAEALKGYQILWLHEAANGSALYALTAAQPGYGAGTCPCVLQRLDPGTLQVTAQRQFDDMPSLYVLGH